MKPDVPLEVSIVGPQVDWNSKAVGGSVQYALKYVPIEPSWFYKTEVLQQKGVLKMYIKDSDYEIIINNRKIVFSDKIKTIIEFNNLVIVLLLDKQYKPNNVIAYNENGNKEWEINEILMIKNPSGFDEIERKTDTILSAYCITGISYDIDIENKKMVSSIFLGQMNN